MNVTREMVADQLKEYLRGACTLDQVVSWAEEVMAEGEIAERDFALVRDTVARLGVSDVAAFGLTWEEIREMLETLGYRARVEFEAAG
ncbi:MAG: hypothetical protein EXS58_02645 [Candidatus Latescibacteria bacterium]|nr:hypothetical protein [Candidatus Latescibacterota bacterium]